MASQARWRAGGPGDGAIAISIFLQGGYGMKRSMAPALALAALLLTAAPAGAVKVEPPNPHTFVGSASVPPTITGEGEFALKPFNIVCEKVKSTSSGLTPTFPSTTFTAIVKYSGCEAEGTVARAEYELKAKVPTPVTYNFHANGVVEFGSGGTVTNGKLEGAGPVEIDVSGPFKCTISIAPGTYPTKSLKKPEAQYETATFLPEEETVEKHKTPEVVKKLAISTALTKLPYELGGEFCEALPKTEYASGTSSSSLLAQIKNGDISWE
jgi:hypothetical protein